jgi:choloylglycine hydrolase
MKKYTLVLAIIILGWSMPQTSQPCTTFCLDLDGQHIFGKNYDWNLERGLVMINKRGVLKTAIRDIKDPGPYARWTSKYGSLTFNQYGRETPMGGINEAGLVIDSMMLTVTKYPEPDSRPTIGSLQWIQYQLDHFSKVEEVISSDSQLRIFSSEPGIHYLVMDKTEDCVSIEFLDGKLVYHTQRTMLVKTLTNNTYAESVEYLKEHKEFGGELSIPKGESSLVRFVQAANMLIGYHKEAENQKPPVDFAFDVLANVAQTSTMWGTKWSIVYDAKNLRAYFRTFSKQQMRYVDLKAFDFSCSEPVKVLDINIDFSGDITERFYDYTQQLNLDLISYAFKGTYFLSGMPDYILEQFSKYPESTLCVK